MLSFAIDSAYHIQQTGTPNNSLVTSFLEKQESGPAAEREERALEMIAATVYSGKHRVVIDVLLMPIIFSSQPDQIP